MILDLSDQQAEKLIQMLNNYRGESIFADIPPLAKYGFWGIVCDEEDSSITESGSGFSFKEASYIGGGNFQVKVNGLSGRNLFEANDNQLFAGTVCWCWFTDKDGEYLTQTESDPWRMVNCEDTDDDSDTGEESSSEVDSESGSELGSGETPTTTCETTGEICFQTTDCDTGCKTDHCYTPMPGGLFNHCMTPLPCDEGS